MQSVPLLGRGERGRSHMLMRLRILTSVVSITCLGVLAVGVPRAQAQGPNLVRDGSFELPDVPGPWETFYAPTTMGPWTVESGSIDLVDETYWLPAHLQQSIDLNGLTAGAIYQDVATVPGTTYSLSFAVASAPDFPSARQVVQVTFGDQSHVFKVPADSAWRLGRFAVTATETSTRLKFQSLGGGNGGNAGPALDRVLVVVSR